MDKVLVLGGIASFCDLVEELNAKNAEAVICDYYKDAPAKSRVRCAYNVSTTDISAVLEIARENQVDAVLSAFSDRNLEPNYIIAQKLHLPTIYTPEIIETLTDKIKMKTHLQKAGFPILPFKIIKKDFLPQDIAEFVFPLVCKPIDSYGSKGIHICSNYNDIIKYFDDITAHSLSYPDSILIEEYYPVDEISISAWVKQGRAYITCIYDVGRNYGTDILLSRVNFPSKYTEDLDRFSTLVQELTDSFGVHEGPVTVQCFIGDRGLKIGEYIFRLAGGSPYLYPVLLGGPNVASMLIDYCLGRPVDSQNLETYRPCHDAMIYDIQIFSGKAGNIHYNFTEASIKNSLKNCIDIRIYQNDGDLLMNVPPSGKVVVRIFYQTIDWENESYSQVLDRLKSIIKIWDDNGNDITLFRLPQTPLETVCYPLGI